MPSSALASRFQVLRVAAPPKCLAKIWIFTGEQCVLRDATVAQCMAKMKLVWCPANAVAVSVWTRISKTSAKWASWVVFSPAADVVQMSRCKIGFHLLNCAGMHLELPAQR